MSRVAVNLDHQRLVSLEGDAEIRVRVHGRAVFNVLGMMRQAALDGLGLVYLPEDLVNTDIRQGQLVRVLADWCPHRPGYHLYYPSPRQPSRSWRRLCITTRASCGAKILV
jgi:DNA-binding transcriptional LysR family regulator